MPTSNLAIWPDILAAVDQVPHRRILDVGPGHGKASVLLREYLTPSVQRVDAVEAWQPYVHQFRLDRLYDRVYIGDVTAATWSASVHRGAILARDALAEYDVVLMGDVIEHIPLDVAFALLHRIPGRVVICTPVEFFDNDPHGQHPPTEAHVSHWTQQTWDSVGEFRSVEVCYERLGGWIVRLGPLG